MMSVKVDQALALVDSEQIMKLYNSHQNLKVFFQRQKRSSPLRSSERQKESSGKSLCHQRVQMNENQKSVKCALIFDCWNGIANRIF